MTTFLRRIYNRYHKLGKKRGKKRKWRKPKGRDNKMREKRRGYQAVVSIGYKKPEAEKKTVIVNNTNDLASASKNGIAIVGKVGKKKKIEIVKKADEAGITLKNVNVKKFLKKHAEKDKSKKPETQEKSK